MTEESVFAAAIRIPDPAARHAYLDRACAGNVELRQQLAALVAAHFAPHPDLAPADGTVTASGYGDTADPDGTHSHQTPAGTAGAVIAGRYKLLQRIGEGGMGEVWMADQTEPVKRRVAVKLIRAERGTSKAVLTRFEAERQAIALMDHPHIAKLLDAGTTADGAPYFVMELVKGVPLTQFCDEHKLSVPDRLRLFAQICSAVQHAHQKGVIHRDLKPTNILIESHGGKPVPKVIDFGLAKAAGGVRLTDHTLFTGFGAVLGTPLYMAPEQATFDAIDVDTRADIYALGVILYELLTGTTPLTREAVRKAALDQVLKLIREQDAPTPSSRLSGADQAPSVAANRQTEPAKLGRFVKGELDWIVLKALAKDRDRRYETANGLAADVERFLNHEPVTAGPPTAGYRLRKFVQRNKGRVIAAGVVALAVLAGFAGTGVGLLEAKRQRDLADDRRREADEGLMREVGLRELADGRLEQVLQARAEETRSANLAKKREGEARRLASFAATNEGLRRAESNDIYGALILFVRAMESDPENPETQSTSRTRFAAYERYGSPLRLTQLIDSPAVAVGAGDSCVSDFSADGTKLLVAGRTLFRQWDLASGQPEGVPLPFHYKPFRTSVVDRLRGNLSGDRSRLLTVTSDRGIQVRDLTTGTVLLDVTPEQAKKRGWVDQLPTVQRLKLLPGGKTLLTFTGNERSLPGVESKLLQLWDVERDRPASPVVPVNPGRLQVGSNIVISEDGRRLAVLCEGGKATESALRIFDAATLAPTGPEMVLSHVVDSIAISPDGTHIASAFNNGQLQIWDTDSGKVVWGTTVSPLSTLRFSADGEFLAVIGSTGPPTYTAKQLQLLDVRNKTVTLVDVPPRAVLHDWSADGRHLALGTVEGIVVIDALTGKAVSPLIHHGGGGSAATFSPDGRRLATTRGDGLIHLWEFRPTSADVALFDRAKTAQYAVTRGPSATQRVIVSDNLVVSGGDFTMWDLKAGRPAVTGLTMLSAHPDPTVDRFVVDTERGPEVWDATTNTRIRVTLSRPGSALGGIHDILRDRVRDLDFAPRGSCLLAESSDGLLHVCDGTTGRPTAIPPVAAGRRPKYDRLRDRVAVSPDGSRIAIVDQLNAIRVWSVRDGQEVGPPIASPRRPNRMTFLDDRRLLTTSAEAQTKPGLDDGAFELAVHDVCTGQPPFPAIILRGLHSWALLPGNRQILMSGGRPRQTTAWDLTTGRPVGGAFPPFTPEVRPLGNLPGGKILLADVGSRVLQTLDPTTLSLRGLPIEREQAAAWPSGRLSADGRRLLHAGRLWDTTTLQPLTPQFLTAGGGHAPPWAAPDLRNVSRVTHGTIRSFDLEETPLPLDELSALSRLWASRRFTDEGVFVDNTKQEQWQLFCDIRNRYPVAFASASAAEVRGWHLRQAADALVSGRLRPFIAEFHLRVLARSEPVDAADRFRLAALHATLARVYNGIGEAGLGVLDTWDRPQPDLALARYQSAVDHFRELVRIDPNDTPALAELASAYEELADWHRKSGRTEEVGARLFEARDVLLQLHRKYPVNRAYLGRLAQVRGNLGIWLRVEGRVKEAEPELVSAADLYRRIVAMQEAKIRENQTSAPGALPGGRQPPRPQALDDLAETLRQVGLLYSETARLKEAATAFAEVVELHRERAGAPGAASTVRINFAASLVYAARAARLREDFAAARALLAEADGHLTASLKLARSSPDFYNAACVLALCASEAPKDPSLTARKQEELTELYASQAVTYLRRSVETRNRGSMWVTPNWIRRDRDLDSLVKRADFKQVIADLEKKIAPSPETLPPPRPVK